jgi:transcriptional regulator with XRE-family HTH domain
MSPEHRGRKVLQVAGHLGLTIADARRARRWTLRDLSERTGLAISWLHAVEHGQAASIETYAVIAAALGKDLRLDLVDPRAGRNFARSEDAVHAAMGEVIASRLSGPGTTVALDEPYQHYQFAGRGDVLAWNLERRALVHIENRTRFPNLQEAIGAYNAKRRYLPRVLAERIGLRGGFNSVTHVMAGLWSSEVIHVVRLRPASFRAIAPDGSESFLAWWMGGQPTSGVTSSFVLLDPAANGRQRPFVGLDAVAASSLRARYRGYADAFAALETARLA